MKKSVIILIVSGVIVLIFCLIVFICNFILPVIILGSPEKSNEELLFTSVSPNENWTLEIYKDNGSATVDYSVKVYVVDNDKKKIIFNQYHRSQAEVTWVNENVVLINSIELDLSKNQTYDWRKRVRPK